MSDTATPGRGDQVAFPTKDQKLTPDPGVAQGSAGCCPYCGAPQNYLHHGAKQVVEAVCRTHRVTPGQVRSRFRSPALARARAEIARRLRNAGMTARQIATVLNKTKQSIHRYQQQ
jgi:hypothetical protein